MELLLILVIALLGVIGYAGGALYRKVHIQRSKMRTSQKPSYAIQNKLTPAEFSLLMRGVVDKHALAGEILSLQNKGYLITSRDGEGRVIIAKTSADWRLLQPSESKLLKSIFPHYARPTTSPAETYTALTDLQRRTKQSMIQRGWLKTEPAHLAISSEMPGRYYARLGITYTMALLLSFGFGVLTNASPTDQTIVLLSALALVSLGSILAALYIHLADFFRRGAGHTLHVTKTYEAEHDKAHSIYLYLSVSGMDTMTPDYEALNFSQLDSLYPYAVASGFDKKATKLLTTKNVRRGGGET